MRTLLLISALAIGALSANGCRTRVVVIDRQSDWVRLGRDVRGHVYLYQDGQWILQGSEVTLPEGWVAGPGAEDVLK